MKAGYIKFYRQIQDHWIWHHPKYLWAWADLLFLANYKDSKIAKAYKIFWVSRGQVFTSQLALAEKWKWDRKTVRKFLRLLETDHMVALKMDRKRDTGGTLITIINYNKYQGDDPDTFPINVPINVPSTSPHPRSKEGKKEDWSSSSSGALYIDREIRRITAVAEKRNGGDAAFAFFSDKFKSQRSLPYRSTKADFIELVRLRKVLGITGTATPGKWEEAVENYFRSPLSRYSLKDLCARLDVFMAAPLDRYGKPDIPEEDYFTKLRRQLKIDDK